MKKILVVLGASSNAQRYSYRAICLAKKTGLMVVPVSLRETNIDNLKAYSNLLEVKKAFGENVEYTLSVYLSEEKALMIVDDIVALNPEHIILNPGADSTTVSDTIKSKMGRDCIKKACTLVLLSTGKLSFLSKAEQ